MGEVQDARFCRLKPAGVVMPLTVAVMVKEPTVPLARKGGEVAIPKASVVAVEAGWRELKRPLLPVVGAVKVTVTPLTGLPRKSVTFA
jgi:hypothetical protein